MLARNRQAGQDFNRNMQVQIKWAALSRPFSKEVLNRQKGFQVGAGVTLR